MNDRGMIKWAPFNSVINGNEVLSSITEEKSKINKPTLSEEQINNLENKIIEAYSKNIQVELIYFKNGKNNKLSGQITKLDPINKKIILNYHTDVYFNNILDILEKNT